MIKSKVLGKSYKTKAAYKGQITKYRKQIAEELKYLSDAYKKGQKLYLGDRIYPIISKLEVELLLIDREKKINLLYDGKAPVIEFTGKK